MTCSWRRRSPRRRSSGHPLSALARSVLHPEPSEPIFRRHHFNGHGGPTLTSAALQSIFMSSRHPATRSRRRRNHPTLQAAHVSVGGVGNRRPRRSWALCQRATMTHRFAASVRECWDAPAARILLSTNLEVEACGIRSGTRSRRTSARSARACLQAASSRRRGDCGADGRSRAYRRSGVTPTRS